MRALRLVALLLAAGCGDGDVDPAVDTDTDTDTDADTDTVVQADRLVVLAALGWDAQALAPRDAILEQRTRVPTAWLVVATSTWDGSLLGDETACVVEVTLDATATTTTWASATDALLALDVTGTVAETRGACEALSGRAPATLAADLLALGWGLGVQVALAPDVADALTARGDDPADFLGGGVRSAVTTDAYLPVGLATGRSVDGSWFVGDPVPAVDLVVDDALVSGWYQLEAGLAWDDVSALLP